MSLQKHFYWNINSLDEKILNDILNNDKLEFIKELEPYYNHLIDNMQEQINNILLNKFWLKQFDFFEGIKFDSLIEWIKINNTGELIFLIALSNILDEYIWFAEKKMDLFIENNNDILEDDEWNIVWWILPNAYLFYPPYSYEVGLYFEWNASFINDADNQDKIKSWESKTIYDFFDMLLELQENHIQLNYRIIKKYKSS
jgi:hypothetical protein